MPRRLSRLARQQEVKNLRRAYFFIFLTIVLIFFIIFLGIPLLIKTAAFLGDLRSSSQTVETKDSLAPPPPRIYTSEETTNKKEIKIEGISESGSKIRIYLNGHEEKEVISDNNGSFNTQIELPGNRNEISAIAEDEAGNKSEESKKIVIIYDNKSPEIEITSPAGDLSDWKDEKLLIEGKTEKESSLYINDRLVILDNEGGFTYQLNLSEGENTIKFLAKDHAGNTGEKELKITYHPF